MAGFQSDEEVNTAKNVRTAIVVLQSYQAELEDIGLDLSPLVDYVTENQGVEGLSDEEKSTALTIAGEHEQEDPAAPKSRAARAAGAVKNLAKRK